MKDAILLLLCAIALAQGINQNPEQRSRPCNCDPSEANQICQANYDNDDVLIAHEYCNQFYKCANGKPVAYYCPNNLLYDPVTELCDWPHNVNCGDRPISEGPVKDEDSDSDDVSDTDNDSTCNCNPGEAPSICAAEGSNGILVAHPNCNQFYSCSEGKPVALTCPRGLLYNPYKEVCDWPENVECGDRVISEPEDGDGNSGDDNNSAGNNGTCNCNPQEAPAICAAPGSEGELIAHENCNKYYICNHGIPIAVSCFGDLLYNPYTEQCDWPRNVDCGDRLVPETDCTGCNDNTSGDTSCDGENIPPEGDPPGDNDVTTRPPGTCNCKPEEAPGICATEGSDGVLVAHENCNKFYKCDHGKPVVLTCHGDLLYNPYTEQCDWPENVDCGDRVIPNPGVTNPPATTPGASIPGNNCDPSEAPTICAADDSDGVLVAHEKCNHFYKCSEGKPVAFLCPDGLLFNPAKDQCDWPENVDCGDRVIPDPESPELDPPGDGVVVPTRPPGTCNCKPEEAPGICATEGSDGILVAHEKCNLFYKCDHGKPVVLKCYGNLLYNPYTEQCDWPENVDCGDREIPDPSVSTTVTNPGVTNPVVTNPPGDSTPGNNCDPSEAPGICAEDNSEGVLVAHEQCNKFYVCNGGKPVVLSCPAGLLFNPAKDQCDWPENVDCGDRVIPDPGSPELDPPGDGVVVPTRPPGTCNCKPEEAPDICAADDSDGILVAHEKCNLFYKCDHGKPVVLKCYGNLLYNPYTEQCDWPENVDCGDRVIPDPSISSTVTNPGVTNPVVTNPPGDSTPGNNCDPSEAPAICAEDNSEGVLVAHEQCNKFYVCNGGKPVVLSCPAGLLFNPAKDQCDWPENVDCGDRVIPDPGSPELDPPGDGVVVPTRPPGTCNCKPEEAPGICAADDSDGILVAHEKCNLFYKCDHGKPVVLKCYGNLLYNPYTEQCDWPENVDCGDRVIPDPSISSTVTNPGVTNPVVTNPPGDSTPGNNCDPSEAPAICAEDNSEGVLVAHEQCNKFYVCNGGKPVVLSCPAGLLFNPAKDQCDWPENVDCGDRVIPDPGSPELDPPGDGVVVPTRPPGTCNCKPEEAPGICAADDSDGILVAHEKCNLFYKCDHGKPVVLKCYGNLLYNPYTEQCDWPENVDCGDRVIPDPSISSTVTNPGVTNPVVTNPPGDSTPGNNCDPSEAPAICAEDNSEGVLVAHEQCNKFYVCNGGKPVVLSCPAGLLFNPAKDQCDWPENVDCGDRVIPDPGSPELDPPGDGVVVPTRPPGTCNCKPEEAPGICAADDSDGILVAHEKCNLFYKCDHGKPVVLKCYGNLLYNPYTEQCDWPENVDCGDRVIPDPSISSTVTNPVVTNPVVTNPPGDSTPGNNCDPSEAPAICAEDNSEGVLVAHEQCNKFYVCNGGKPVVLSCPAGLLFNPAKDQCDWPENVDCGDRVIPDPGSPELDPPGDGVVVPTRPPGTCNCKPEEAPGICAADDSDGILVAHEKCNLFYKCDHGKPVVLKCYGNLLYNPYTEQCDWPENVDCGDRVIPDSSISSTVTNPGVTNPVVTNPPGDSTPGNNCDPSEAPAICAEDNSEGVLVAHEQCNKFYVCNGGKPVVLSCPAGLLFNPAKDQCDWPENVDCGDRVIPDPGSPELDPPGDGVVVPTRPPGTCNCKPEEAPGICAADDSDGILVAHEKCNLFYKCDHGKPVVLKCYGNLLYNPYTEQCDWPENVDCGDRVIPDPSISSTVTNPGVTNPVVTNPPGDSTPGNNCDPSEAPAICAEDNSEGVLVAHEQCNKFFVCNGGKPVVLSCPAGLLFNPAKDQCDWPENVDCGDRVIPDPGSPELDPPGDGVVVPTRPPGTCNCKPEEAPGICAADDSDGILVAHEKCNLFYKCDHGKPVVLKCYGNLLYNPYTEQCDWPENVDCGDRVIPDPSISSTVTNPVVTNPVVTNPPGDSTPGNNCDPSEAPAICAEDNSEGVLVAHEQCNKFYVCNGGKPVVLSCPAGLLFNPAKDQCDWPENVDCGDRVIPDPGSPELDPPGDGVVVPTRPPGTCNCKPEEAPGICAADDSDGILVAHEKCNLFYKCDHGKPVVLKCYGNLLYNPYTEQCDWPENVDCGDRVIPDPSISSTVTNPGVTNPVVTNPPGDSTPGNNCDPSEAPAICAEDNSEGVLVAHEQCNKFYVCNGGKPVVLSCPAGLLFNPAKDQCDWPENVDCGDRVIPDPGSPELDPPGDGVVVPTRPPGTCNCKPEEAPGICAADDSDGILVAHEKCNLFYKCDHGKPVVLKCYGNLLYNPYTEQCDWPENVDCGDRVIPDPSISSTVTNPGVTNPVVTNPPGDSTPGNNCDPSEAPAICAEDNSEGVLVAHEQCNKFYVCNGGKPVVLSCPAGLLFNPAKDQCDWPENVDCGDRVIPDPGSPELDPPGDGVVVPTRPPGTCNCKPEEAPGICAADDSDGILVAHEKCNLFYKCDHGKPVVLKCYGNLLYNPYTEQCDWPENVDCGDRVIPDPSISSTVTNPGVTNPVVTNPPGDSTPGNNCDPSEAPAICAEDNSEGVLVAHEQCNKFYVCNGGKPVVLSCPAGLLFNPAKDQCDWPENVDCGDRVIPDPGSPELDPPGDGVVVPTRPPGTCNCKPEEAPGICAADDSDGILVAHEKCNLFYKCDHGKPVVLKCYGNLLYNPYTEQCDWPENVDCGDRVIPDPSISSTVTNPGVTNPVVTNPPGDSTPGNNCDPSEAPAICAEDNSEGVLVAHEQCNKFYVCNGGKPVVLSCPAGLLFNPPKDQCDWPENVDCGDRVIPDPGSPELDPPGDGVVVPTRPPGTCNCKPEEAPGICAADDSDGILVAHEKCNLFYKCDHGKPVVLKCYGNLLYNPYTEQCDWPENVDCGDRVIPDPSVSSTVTNPGVTNPVVSDSPGDSTPGNNCDPSEAPAICAEDNSEGVLVAHEQCNKFYVCNGGKPVVLSCPAGLLFNPPKDQCDWPENVDCGDRVIPDPGSPELDPPGDGVVVPTRPPGTCNCKPEEAPGICAADDSDGILVAHEKCNLFYKCDHGKPVVLKCYGNLLYNPYTEQCDWPENVDCGDRVIPDPSVSSTVTNPGVTNPVVSDSPGDSTPGNNCDPSEAPAICAEDNSEGVLVAHEQCNKFYVCNGGKPVVLSCPSGLLFKPATDQCDWPQNVDCGDRVIPNPGVTNPPATTPGATIPGNNCDPSEAPTICAANDSDGVLVAHENCDKFYKCSEGKPVALSCPDGLLFNPAKDQCDWPNNVVCGDRIIPDDCACNPRNAPALCSKPGSQGKLIAHEKCNQFYICTHSVPVAQSCPAGLFYNVDREFCDWPQNVNCGNRVLAYMSLNKHSQSRQTLRN